MGRRSWLSFRTFTTGGSGASGLRSVSGVVAALELVLITVDGTGVCKSDRGEPCGEENKFVLLLFNSKKNITSYEMTIILCDNSTESSLVKIVHNTHR